MQLNLATEQYARTLGLKPSEVSAIKQERAARERLQKVGINIDDQLPTATLRTLGFNPSCVVLCTSPFVLPVKQVVAIVTARAATSVPR